MLVLDGSGSVWGNTCWYLVVLDQQGAVMVDTYMMVLGQYRAVLVGTWWYWVSRGRYWSVLGGTGSEEGNTG